MEPQKKQNNELESFLQTLREQKQQLETSKEEFGQLALRPASEAEMTVRKAVSGMLNDPQFKKLTGRAKADEVARGITGCSRQALANTSPERPSTLPQAKLFFYSMDEMCRQKPELKADIRALVQKYLSPANPYPVLACGSLVELLQDGLGAVPLPAEIDLNRWANRKPLYHIYAEPEFLAEHSGELQPITYAMAQVNILELPNEGPGSPITLQQYHILKADLDKMMRQPDGKEKSKPLQQLDMMDLLDVLDSPGLPPEQTLEKELLRRAPYVPLAVFTNDPARAEQLLELPAKADFTWKLRVVRYTPEKGFEDWDLIRR